MAYYGKPDQEWVFYEIDPVVAEVASSSPYFSYLETSDAEIEIILGDGRFALTKAPNGKFQVIIVDAFSSDVIPVHLLTREALELYFSKLTADGAILFHVSNRHFNLKPVLANLALDAGFVCYWQDGKDATFDDLEKGQDPSEWMVIARTAEDVEPITNIARWQRIERQQGDVLWTDDQSSILDVLFP